VVEFLQFAPILQIFRDMELMPAEPTGSELESLSIKHIQRIPHLRELNTDQVPTMAAKTHDEGTGPATGNGIRVLKALFRLAYNPCPVTIGERDVRILCPVDVLQPEVLATMGVVLDDGLEEEEEILLCEPSGKAPASLL
jgi:hypothetical protein